MPAASKILHLRLSAVSARNIPHLHSARNFSLSLGNKKSLSQISQSNADFEEN
jgi:hypothetical protein